MDDTILQARPKQVLLLLMLVFYNIGVQLYGFGIRIVALFNPKAAKWKNGRIGLLQRIEQEIASFAGKTVWVHCASLGEFEMARPIIEGIKKEENKTRIILTFFSPSGFEVRKDYALADHVFYLPLDTAHNARRFIAAVSPSTVVFVKYDIWYHHLNEANKIGAKMILISAQFRSTQQYFKFYGGIGRKALQLFDRIFLVDKNSERLAFEIDLKNTQVCGDTRYDRVMEIAKASNRIAAIEEFKGESKLVVCGSTWPEDEKVLKESLNKYPTVKWVIAPHEVGEQNIQRLAKLFANAIRFSALKGSAAKVCIVDSIGQLSKLYKYADVAYVGGAFGKLPHNILEATAYGVPTIFGPNYMRFPDAAEMVEKEICFNVRNQEELNARLDQLLNRDQTNLRSDIRDFMQSRTGASAAVMKYLNTDG